MLTMKPVVVFSLLCSCLFWIGVNADEHSGFECSHPMNKGYSENCTEKPSIRFHLDSNTRVCVAFLYNGCGGNGNNFETLSECYHNCVNGLRQTCPLNTAKIKSDTKGFSICNLENLSQLKYSRILPCDKEGSYCNLENTVIDIGSCCSIEQRNKLLVNKAGQCGDRKRLEYFDGLENVPLLGLTCASDMCPKGSTCHQGEVFAYCCEDKVKPTCNQSLDIGSSDNCSETPSIRWHMDEATATCLAFNYTGCGGNQNNFETQQDCYKTCLTNPDIPRCPMNEKYLEDDSGNYMCGSRPLIVYPELSKKEKKGSPRWSLEKQPSSYWKNGTCSAPNSYCELNQESGLGLCCSKDHKKQLEDTLLNACSIGSQLKIKSGDSLVPLIGKSCESNFCPENSECGTSDEGKFAYCCTTALPDCKNVYTNGTAILCGV